MIYLIIFFCDLIIGQNLDFLYVDIDGVSFVNYLFLSRSVVTWKFY